MLSNVNGNVLRDAWLSLSRWAPTRACTPLVTLPRDLTTLRRMHGRGRLRQHAGALIFLVAGLALSSISLLSGCPQNGEDPTPADMALPTPQPPDLPPVTKGALFADCTPAGYSDVVCDTGLRCGFVQVGDAGKEGTLTQCVPTADKPLGLNEVCAFDQQAASPTGGVQRRHDRCGPGLGCVQTEPGPFRCRTLCELRKRSGCKDQLCVLGTLVSGIGYCASADGCKPVSPQAKCGLDAEGKPLTCYVLTDDKGGGTFCMRRQPFGTSSGVLDAPCERSPNCDPGLACTPRSGRDSACRPYCDLPEIPDGGTRPDMAGQIPCGSDLGICRAISGYEHVGRCY